MHEKCFYFLLIFPLIFGLNGCSSGSSSSSSSETCSSSTFDLSQFSGNYTSASEVSCTLENGSTTTCCQITFAVNLENDDGPFCPSTSSTDHTLSGLGNYDGSTNPGIQDMVATLWTSMETDGYDITNGTPGDGSVGSTIKTWDFGGGMPTIPACLEPAVDDTLTATFLIPLTPEALSTVNTIDSVELVGLSLKGAHFNGAPPSVIGNSGNIPSLDDCGGHHDPSGYYHWHFVPQSVNNVFASQSLVNSTCTTVTQDTDALFGWAKDGYPIYAMHDDGGVTPTGLDSCNGHTGATPEFPDGVYHYHAQETAVPNIPPCLIGAAVSPSPVTVE